MLSAFGNPNIAVKIFLALSLVVLGGCSSSEFSDLQDYVDEVKANSKGRIPPLPEFVPAKSFEYAAADMGDPFMSWTSKAALSAREEQEQNNVSGLQPDLGRRREPLEAFPLDTLRMVGTIEMQGLRSALVQSPDGLVSRVVPGNYLGQNYGQVLGVNQDKIELMEIVSDGLGSWVERPASLAIVE